MGNSNLACFPVRNYFCICSNPDSYALFLLFRRYVPARAINIRVNISYIYIVWVNTKMYLHFSVNSIVRLYRIFSQLIIEIPRNVIIISSKLKQSRYCIILIVSSDVSINVSLRSMFRSCKNYNSLVYCNSTIWANVINSQVGTHRKVFRENILWAACYLV